MTLIQKTLKYARAHLQPVRIVWLNREPDVVGAVEAVEMCADPRMSGYIVSAVAQDKTFEKMLNLLLDEE